MNEQPKLHNSHIDHIVIHSELKRTIGGKVLSLRKCGTCQKTAVPVRFGFLIGYYWLQQFLFGSKLELEPNLEFGTVAITTCILSIVSKGCKLPGRFRVRFHPNPDCGNRSYHTNNPDRRKWGAFSPKNLPFEIDHFGSNEVFQF